MPADDTAASTSFTEMEELRKIARDAAAAAASASAALERMAASMDTQARKKPELPNFESKNVDIWIQRIESAFTRVNIISPRDKFAHLESKFNVDLNPRINDFLFGAPTAANWESFLAYLRAEYGRTREQQAAAMIDGVPRDGRRPTQWASKIVDLTKEVTIDDIRKEQLLRELPPEVRRAMADKVKNLTFLEAAELADNYFDRDGRLLHASTTSTINRIDHAPGSNFAEPEPSQADSINAVHRRSNQPRSANQQPRYTPSYPSSSTSQRAAHSNASSTSTANTSSGLQTATICFYHREFGKKAKKCEPGCQYKPSENGKAGPRK